MADFVNVGSTWVNMDHVLKVTRWVASPVSRLVKDGTYETGEVIYTLYFDREHHFYKGDFSDEEARQLDLSEQSGHDFTEIEMYLALPEEQRREIPGIKSNKGPL